ncbi:unnamed protein product, partial [Staurois parvus]
MGAPYLPGGKGGPMAEIRGLGSINGRPVIAGHHPYDKKMEHTSIVRTNPSLPESGTWQSVAIETAAMGGRTGTHERLWTSQQH